jgi:hypothetical protein
LFRAESIFRGPGGGAEVNKISGCLRSEIDFRFETAAFYLELPSQNRYNQKHQRLLAGDTMRSNILYTTHKKA